MAGYKSSYEINFKLKVVEYAEYKSNQAAAKTFDVVLVPLAL